jgi:site-specific recombinase XerD
MPRTSFPPCDVGIEESRFAHDYLMFSSWLYSTGYSNKNVSDHLGRLRQVLEHTAGAARDSKRSAQYIHKIFEKYCISPWFTKGYRATERAYDKFLDSQRRLIRSTPRIDPMQHSIKDYQRYLTDVCGLSSTTVQMHGRTILDFLSHSHGLARKLANLTTKHVDRYVASKSKKLTRGSLLNVVARLRGFARYAFVRGMIREPLDTIDTPRLYRGELPPRALPWPLVLRLLRSVDRSDASGRRDYAILHLMAYYGLRISEVAALTLDSIDWSSKKMIVAQRKTHSTLVLPLPEQTITILRAYVRHGRPASAIPRLFLRAHRPATGLEHHAIAYIFQNRVQQSGLSMKGYSSYCLRHAFAMRLLKRGVGVKAIGDLMGHHSLESTCVYLRLDMDTLRDVALPLPPIARLPT